MQRASATATNRDYIQVEEFDNATDSKFVREFLQPYFKDLFRDLSMRSLTPNAIQEKKLDKVTFMEYCNLPGIIADRLFKMFDTNSDGLVSEASFINNLTKIFISDLDTKMHLTFNMQEYYASNGITDLFIYRYDFNGDGFITKEDVRMVMSYIPFQRSMNDTDSSSGSQQLSGLTFSSQAASKTKQKEGLYEHEEGKSMNYNDRIVDQEEIKGFINSVFSKKSELSFPDYLEFNNSVSSEMFFSIMCILHERLPCSQNFFRLKKIYRTKINMLNVRKSQSPSRTIASPTMLKGMSLIKKNPLSRGDGDPSTPVVCIQNKLLNNKSSQKNSVIGSLNSSQVFSGFASSPNNEEEKEDIFQENSGLQPSKFKRQQQERIEDPSASLKIPLHSTQSTFMKARNSRDIGSPSSGMKQAVRLNMNQKHPSILGEKDQTYLPVIKSPQGNQKSTPISKSTFSRKISKQEGGNTPNIQSPLGAKLQQSEQIQPPILFDDDVQEQQQQHVIENFGNQDKNSNYVFKEGECWLKTKSDRFKKHWMVVMGNELYCYRQKNDAQHRIMHCLVGTFIKELPEESSPSQNLNLWPLKIVLPPNKSRILYFSTQSEQSNWSLIIKESVGYANLFDYYTLDKTLGQGQFGQVKLAAHKKTDQHVAIKTVRKKDMKSIEVYQQRREIEVLKMCQHPNIIKLIDLFENSDYYYIVLEYMEGKDLFDYLKYRNFKITEDRARHMTLQIAQAIQYLHSYGIVHRDIKLENVMMSDNSDKAVPKLVDFGLAKIIGPSEKADEPFGTLGYVAPEVLKKEPYTFSCDLWSLGCITYALLSGSLPFDHESSAETIKMTLNSPLVFDLPCWKFVSEDAKDFITKLLIKDSAKRMKLDQALSHQWLKKFQLKK